MSVTPKRPRSTLLSLVLLWVAFYGSVTLFAPALLDDADSVHVEVAREMLLRHDYVTLYANGIRYLEKAPLLYWSMAAAMKLAMVFGATAPRTLAAAARVPLALAMLALTLLLEAFARRLTGSARAGLYAGLIVSGCFGMFLYTRTAIPDAMVCLWTTAALYCFYRTEESVQNNAQLRLWCGGFAAACALNVLTKGLIGVIFPVGVVGVYFLMTRGMRRSWQRLREMHPLATMEAFLLIAVPWHLLAGLANPTQGTPAPFRFVDGHWLVPMPTDGNVRGWFWFYFMNEHVLRYLNMRIPHDYDTVPIWIFCGLCFLWLMPWSAFVFKAVGWAVPLRDAKWRSQFRRHDLPLKRRGLLLTVVWAAVVLLFFSLSTRQEYYVLPALPAAAMLIAGWLAYRAPTKEEAAAHRTAAGRVCVVIFAIGACVTALSIILLINAGHAAPNTDLASLLNQNPAEYALSLGHFFDLTGPSVALFRFPLGLSAASFFFLPLAAIVLRKFGKTHVANVALAGLAFSFLVSVHLGLKTFAPVLTSAQLAEAIAPQVHAGDIVAIHGEYESGSSLGFYLKRTDIHILEGRSSNLWYGSFFADAPPWFETRESLAAKWAGPRRIFLWVDPHDRERKPFVPAGPVYTLVSSGGKMIVSNQPNR